MPRATEGARAPTPKGPPPSHQHPHMPNPTAVAALKLPFGEALEELKKGRRIRRLAWPRTHSLILTWPHDKKAPPAIVKWGMKATQEWKPEHVDLLAMDWVVER